MFTPLTSSSSSSHHFVPYANTNDPTKLLVVAQQEMSLRYLQERLLNHPPMNLPPINHPPMNHPPIISPMSPHNYFGRNPFPILSFFGADIGSTASALVHNSTTNPFPASTKLSNLQGQKQLQGQLNSLFQNGSSSVFPTYNQYGGHQLSFMSQPINSQQKELMGAFQIKNFSSNNHYYNPLTHLINIQHVKDKDRNVPKKSGKWSIAHIRLAWEIHLDQQRKTQIKEEKKVVFNQSNANKSMISINDYQPSKKRKLNDELFESQCVNVCVEDDDDHFHEKRKSMKPHEFITSSEESYENHKIADNSSIIYQSHQSITQKSHSINHVKKKREAQESSSNSKSFIHKTSNDSSTCNSDNLINLLKTTDVYTPLPIVVSQIPDQSTIEASPIPR